jgi:hypothetical protein
MSPSARGHGGVMVVEGFDPGSQFGRCRNFSRKLGDQVERKTPIPHFATSGWGELFAAECLAARITSTRRGVSLAAPRPAIRSVGNGRSAVHSSRGRRPDRRRRTRRAKAGRGRVDPPSRAHSAAYRTSLLPLRRRRRGRPPARPRDSAHESAHLRPARPDPVDRVIMLRTSEGEGRFGADRFMCLPFCLTIGVVESNPRG